MTMHPGPRRAAAAARAAAGGDDTILRRVRRYMELHRRATLGDLALHFDTPAPAMVGMLDTWVRKGRIKRLDVRATCNVSCPLACDDSAMTIFEWVDAATTTPVPPAIDRMHPGSEGACRQRT
jgi:hypothetical protein